MNIIECDREAGLIMMKTIGVEPVCKYCNTSVTEDNFGGIFSKPTRVCCDELVCLMQAIDDNENKDGTVDGIINPRKQVKISDQRFRWM